MSSETKYEILESISQGKNREMSPENAYLAQIANDIRRAVESCRRDETEYGKRYRNGTCINDIECRCAESWAKEHDCWINVEKILNLGIPGPSGSESDTYISIEGYVYKINNLMHCSGSIIDMLIKTILYNSIFADSSYQFVGFTGFEGRSVYPIVKQGYISNGKPATMNEIDCYMAACGFLKITEGKYENDEYLVWDILPKNALKDESGDIFVIDAEISQKNK